MAEKTKCLGSCQSFARRQQAVRVTESKCLHRTPKGVRAARKGTRRLLPGVESWSSQVRAFDGMLKPNPEDSLHYCLLLGDGDINNRGEGDEAFNTRVCRLRGAQKASMRRPSPSQDRACAKTDPFYGPFVYRCRIPPFQGGEMGSIPIRATNNLMNQNVAKPGYRAWSGATRSQVRILPF